MLGGGKRGKDMPRFKGMERAIGRRKQLQHNEEKENRVGIRWAWNGYGTGAGR